MNTAPFGGEKIGVALVSFTLGAYTAASDNGQLTAISARRQPAGKTLAETLRRTGSIAIRRS